MKDLTEFVHHAEQLIKYQIEALNSEEQSFLDCEKSILDLINQVGSLIESMIIKGISEPTRENRIMVNGHQAVYKGTSSLRFTDRFGQVQTIRHRAYKVPGQQGYVYPLDHKIGMRDCRRYSPLLTYLMCSYGANESYACSSRLLSSTLGFSLSSTAVQNNAEMIGGNLPDDPVNFIPKDKQNQECDCMIVQTDGTMSPQIQAIEGVTGRESLKAPTEYKECNVVAIEKYQKGKRIDHWVGADYGKRVLFEEYFRKTTMMTGFMKAKNVVFIADGARHNWDMCRTYLPEAVEILDFYHAIEHLSQFCQLMNNPQKQQKNFMRWRKMIKKGDVLQVLCEMKNALVYIENRDEAQKEINYLNTNKHRMAYDDYQEHGFPIGSGLVEGKCKLVVNKRFKRNGMRWRVQDNKAILKARLAFLNSTLQDYFRPKVLKIGPWQQQCDDLSTRVA